MSAKRAAPYDFESYPSPISLTDEYVQNSPLFQKLGIDLNTVAGAFMPSRARVKFGGLTGFREKAVAHLAAKSYGDCAESVEEIFRVVQGVLDDTKECHGCEFCVKLEKMTNPFFRAKDYLLRGDLKQAQGELEPALADYCQAITTLSLNWKPKFNAVELGVDVSQMSHPFLPEARNHRNLRCECFCRRGHLRTTLGRFEEAMSDLSRAIAMFRTEIPSGRAFLLFDRAKCFHFRKMDANALEDVNVSIRLHDQISEKPSLEMQDFRRTVLLGMGRFEEDFALTRSRTCANCGVVSERRLKKCSGCHSARYCNRNCQIAAWKTHKLVCQK